MKTIKNNIEYFITNLDFNLTALEKNNLQKISRIAYDNGMDVFIDSLCAFKYLIESGYKL